MPRPSQANTAADVAAAAIASHARKTGYANDCAWPPSLRLFQFRIRVFARLRAASAAMSGETADRRYPAAQKSVDFRPVLFRVPG
jgi:hypothetical protein